MRGDEEEEATGGAADVDGTGASPSIAGDRTSTAVASVRRARVRLAIAVDRAV